MKLFAVLSGLIVVALAAPLGDLTQAQTTTGSTVVAYTAAIDTRSDVEPPPLWDPATPPAPPLFEAPQEDLPVLPSWLISVHKAPVQAVRVEKLSPFTGANVHPLHSIYPPSASDEEGRFEGEGSLRPARKTVSRCLVGFLRSWLWWISVIMVAAVLVYVGEKMFIGSVIAARRARSVSRVARSRAASLVQGTRSRAASFLGEAGLTMGGAMEYDDEKAIWNTSKPAMSDD